MSGTEAPLDFGPCVQIWDVERGLHCFRKGNSTVGVEQLRSVLALLSPRPTRRRRSMPSHAVERSRRSEAQAQSVLCLEEKKSKVHSVPTLPPSVAVLVPIVRKW